MKNVGLVFGFSAAMAVVMAAMSGCSKAVAQSEPAKEDRGIELTVYKDDFAMVSERRSENLEAGHTKLVLDDVSKLLDPNSVLFDWPSQTNHPSVIATTYNLGLGSGSTLMSRLNGHQVDLMWPSSDGKQGDMVSGRLEAAQDGTGFALRTADKLYVNPNGTIVASAKTDSTLPQLSVEVENPTAGKTKLGLSYLTRGMAWTADYVAKLNPRSNTAELECWATVTNITGIPFPAAKLTLMAGSPNRSVQSAVTLSPPSVVGGATSTGTVTLTNGSPYVGFTKLKDADGYSTYTTNAPREVVGDIYAYKVPSTASIGMDQMNRVSMLGTRTVPINRDYAVRIPSLTAWGYQVEGTRPHVSASVTVSFVNNAASNLGIPLPAGAVRVYEKDESGREIYTGADHISDTPKQEHVALTLSDAFDVYAEYKVVKSERIDKHYVRKTVETVVHNEKKSPIKTRVVQDISERWKPVSESDKSVRLDSTTIQWRLALKPGEAKKLTYTVDIRA